MDGPMNCPMDGPLAHFKVCVASGFSIGLALDWHWISIGLVLNWHWISIGLVLNWHWISIELALD